MKIKIRNNGKYEDIADVDIFKIQIGEEEFELRDFRTCFQLSKDVFSDGSLRAIRITPQASNCIEIA